MTPLAIAVLLSTNRKLGWASATYAAQASCPERCPLRGAGCYAEHGPVGIITRRLNRTQAEPLDVARAEAEAIATLPGMLDLRLHVVGDCASDAAAAIVSAAALRQTRPGRAVWTYTHAWRDVDRAAWAEVSILASLEDPRDIPAARERGYAAALIVPEHTSDALHHRHGERLLPCPEQTRGVRCSECRLCMDAERLHRERITITFRPHGTRAAQVRSLVQITPRPSPAAQAH
jgi:hypothetical protein